MSISLSMLCKHTTRRLLGSFGTNWTASPTWYVLILICISVNKNWGMPNVHSTKEWKMEKENPDPVFNILFFGFFFIHGVYWHCLGIGKRNLGHLHRYFFGLSWQNNKEFSLDEINENSVCLWLYLSYSVSLPSSTAHDYTSQWTDCHWLL